MSAPKLATKTTQADRTKIISAFRGVQGVQRATLNLGAHEVEITGRDQKDPKREDISAAATRVGYPLAAN